MAEVPARETAEKITVEVAYALPDRQKIVALEVEPGCTAFDAAVRSGIADSFAEIDIERADMGIFGNMLDDPRTRVLYQGERVEIYRPMTADPKEVRRRRAAEAKARRAAQESEKTPSG